MANCIDCINYSACKCGKLNASNEVESWCDLFKDRSHFVELPIKPGEKVFYFDTAGRIYESTVTQLVYGATGFLIDSDVMFNSNLIGERFFLTREAAERAFKEHEIND